jgi:hypothetical protein
MARSQVTQDGSTVATHHPSDERRTERELVLPEGISDVLSVSSMSELGDKIKQILVRNNFVTTAWHSV